MAASRYEPTVFEVSVSAGMGAGFAAALANGRLRYYLRNDDQSQEEVSVAPTAVQWRSFRRTLDRLDAWAWHGHYEPPPQGMATDGVDWQIAVTYADGAAIRCGGYNAYPPHGD